MTGHQLKLVGHDLPPFWDGERVKWEPWSTGAQIIICPPPPLTAIACDQCGVIDQTKTLLCFGKRLETGEQQTSELRQLPSGNSYTRTTTRPPRHVRDLVAYRCPHCGHDRVWDKRTDDWWDLEPHDYEDTGSTADTLF